MVPFAEAVTEAENMTEEHLVRTDRAGTVLDLCKNKT